MLSEAESVRDYIRLQRLLKSEFDLTLDLCSDVSFVVYDGKLAQPAEPVLVCSQLSSVGGFFKALAQMRAGKITREGNRLSFVPSPPARAVSA